MPEHIRQLLNAPAFALQELRLIVVSAAPKGIVHIDAKTQVELLPEYKETSGERRPTVTYDDLGGMRGHDRCAARNGRAFRSPSELFPCLGFDPPRACCFTDPPDGKTLLARAVDNESAANFFAIAARRSGFGLWRERAQAPRIVRAGRRSCPIDHFHRRARFDSRPRAPGQREAEKVSSRSCDADEGSRRGRNRVVIAATNRPEAIDEASRRPAASTKPRESSSACGPARPKRNPRHAHAGHAARSKGGPG